MFFNGGGNELALLENEFLLEILMHTSEGSPSSKYESSTPTPTPTAATRPAWGRSFSHMDTPLGNGAALDPTTIDFSAAPTSATKTTSTDMNANYTGEKNLFILDLHIPEGKSESNSSSTPTWRPPMATRSISNIEYGTLKYNIISTPNPSLKSAMKNSSTSSARNSGSSEKLRVKFDQSVVDGDARRDEEPTATGTWPRKSRRGVPRTQQTWSLQ